MIFLISLSKKTMDNQDIGLLIDLIDKDIDNFQSVYERTGKEHWKENIDNLNRIRRELIGLTSDLLCSDCGSKIYDSYVSDENGDNPKCFHCYEESYEKYISNEED